MLEPSWYGRGSWQSTFGLVSDCHLTRLQMQYSHQTTETQNEEVNLEKQLSLQRISLRPLEILDETPLWSTHGGGCMIRPL